MRWPSGRSAITSTNAPNGLRAQMPTASRMPEVLPRPRMNPSKTKRSRGTSGAEPSGQLGQALARPAVPLHVDDLVALRRTAVDQDDRNTALRGLFHESATRVDGQ